jgi:uncharacterized Zn finger protein (UPF0148 family)
VNTIYRRVSDQMLTVQCPECSGAAKHRVMVILTDKKVTCPTCDHVVDVDTMKLEQKIEAAQARRNARSAPPPPRLTDAEISGPLATLQ